MACLYGENSNNLNRMSRQCSILGAYGFFSARKLLPYLVAAGDGFAHSNQKFDLIIGLKMLLVYNNFLKSIIDDL